MKASTRSSIGVIVTDAAAGDRISCVNGVVTTVGSNPVHTIAKVDRGVIRLLAGLGVEGDAHAGTTVKHRSRVARDPTSRTCGRCTSCTRSCTTSCARPGSR